ncbi:MAG: YcdB/YcdC domain-containing protein [Clostridium sp.]|uniref:YcdB/YcdC domain-containing protein n=1 Tax=Clostridium sp. TaxID=1506 RepID=UPI003D6DA0B0
MNKKRIFSILMSTTLIFGTATPSFAAQMNTKNAAKIVIVNEKKEVTISEDKAEEIAMSALKTYFDVDVKAEKLKNTSASELDSYEKNSFWNLNWQNEAKAIYVNAHMDAKTGKLLRINTTRDTSEIDEEIKVKISSKEAEKISNEFLEKFNKDDLKECAEAKVDIDWKYYRVNYVKKVNGIKVPGESINVVVDGSSKNIISYSTFLNKNIKFPENKNTIDIKKAEEKLRKEINLEPLYREKYVQDKNGVYKSAIELVYLQNCNTVDYIDAFTGEILKYGGFEEINDKLDLDSKEKESFCKKYKVNINKELIDTKEAENIAKEHIKNLYGSEYTLEKLSCNEQSKRWIGHFYKEKDGKRDYEGDISINKNTREISYIGTYSKEENLITNAKPKLSCKEAYEKALDTVVKYYPNKIRNIITKQQVNVADVKQYMTFNFGRVEDGIPFFENNIAVTVNTITGNIETINMEWSEGVQLPSEKNMISKDKALDNLFKKYKPELIYSFDGYGDDAKVRLVYTINGNDDINAITGEIILREEGEIR